MIWTDNKSEWVVRGGGLAKYLYCLICGWTGLKINPRYSLQVFHAPANTSRVGFDETTEDLDETSKLEICISGSSEELSGRYRSGEMTKTFAEGNSMYLAEVQQGAARSRALGRANLIRSAWKTHSEERTPNSESQNHTTGIRCPAISIRTSIREAIYDQGKIV